MTTPAALDAERPHITTAPHAVPYTAMFVGFCSCGAEFVGLEDEVRAAGQPHRDAEKARVPKMVDRERDEVRRRRREARREQRRSKAVHSGERRREVR